MFSLFNFLRLVCGVTSVKNMITHFVLPNVLEMCVVEIASSKTLHGANVAIIRDNLLENDLVKKLHESYNIKIFEKDQNVSVNVSPDVYIIHCDNKIDFEITIDNLNRDWYRKPDALHIVVLINMTTEDVPAIFKVLWNYHIIHVLITITETEEDPSIYSYLPYSWGHCGRDYNNTIKLGQCRELAGEDIVEKLRERDKPDLKNCTFNILAHHYPPLVLSDLYPKDRFAVGIERFLVELLLEMEHISPNFTFVPETVEFGSILNNFTVTGVMEKLLNNEVDLLFGGFSLSYNRAVFFDFSCIHLAFEDIFFPVTPNAQLVQRWKIVYIMFDYQVWLLVLFAMLFCSALLSGLDNFTKCGYNCSSELLKLFGNATQNISLRRRQNLSDNVIIVPWLWFTFLMSCYYQTRLTSFSTYRHHEPQINEYMSLENHNLTPCMPQDIAAFLKNSDRVPIIHEHHLETEKCNTADLALDEVATSSSKYTVTIYYKYLWWASNNLKKKRRVHVTQEYIYKTHYALFFKRGFPLRHEFEKKMSRLIECGFVYAIKGLHNFPEDVRYASDITGAFEVCVLTLHDLIIPFSILVAGHLFALVVFVIEIFNKYDNTYVLFQH